jgi:hypothetical protein
MPSLEAYEFDSDEGLPLRLYVQPGRQPPKSLRLIVRSDTEWRDWIAKQKGANPELLREEIAAVGLAGDPNAEHYMSPHLVPFTEIEVSFAPRGIGLSAWGGTDKDQAHIRRRFMLLGQTLDSMRVWDIRRALQALRTRPEFKDLPVTIEARGAMAVNALYASLFEPGVALLRLTDLPQTHQQGPDYLNVLRFLDLPQAVAMAAERTQIKLIGARPEHWVYPQKTIEALGWGQRLLVEDQASR